MSFKKKRYYILFVSRESDGTLNKVPVPLHYAYIFVAAAAIGMFTMTGLAGSYSRMLIKTSRFNQLRQDHDSLQKDYAHLEKQAHEKDVQAASLGSLASEVSALYGFTTSKLAIPMGRLHGKSAGTVSVAATALKAVDGEAGDDSYYRSIDAFYALRNSALSGKAASMLPGSMTEIAGVGRGSSRISGFSDFGAIGNGPSLWPVMGPISSGFGQREDPVLGTGEGEFHKGVDITAPMGTPVRATADGMIKSADMVNGYGREVVIDHGHGLETCYGHMSGFAVIAGQTVVRGQVIGFVGHSGRTTGNHVHYEVRIHETPVNPHKYLRDTLAGLGTAVAAL